MYACACVILDPLHYNVWPGCAMQLVKQVAGPLRLYELLDGWSSNLFARKMTVIYGSVIKGNIMLVCLTCLTVLFMLESKLYICNCGAFSTCTPHVSVVKCPPFIVTILALQY